MRIDLSTAPGSPERPNEDWTSVALPAGGPGGSPGQSGVIVVLDGVTPPPSETGCVHSVPWFTARLGGSLIELSGSRPESPLREVLAGAIARTADAHRSTCDLSHVRTPQATVVMVRWGAERVEHLVLSDSVLLMEGADGEVRAVLDDRLDRVPREALRSHATADVYRNAEGGFFTAAADPGVAARAVTGSTPRREVRALAAMTDGVSRWVDLFGAGSWADCLGVLRKEGAEGLIGRVRALEAEPEGPVRWKRHDDAAVAFAEL
ncbi:protein phosphatase 2C domain-containing protein [Streptomyces sp. NBC_00237]|uniref:protein phosphatase 2C domain-containing protein n=1 Tax=Streptomyces sp. NBC_00237 TaxID=2975687 RepID=UPI002253EA4E|nr:protein phosphatase 2C domain-containing protein [Streptomyces sp. NBC_00237]MCX5204246.1 protein phosphatase 2C domain-containing protein [Streptomyces sp. NBC_00237]